MCISYNAIWSYWRSLKSDKKKNKMFSVNKKPTLQKSSKYLCRIDRSNERTEQASLLHGWCVVRPFRGVGQTNNDDAGICDSNAVGTRPGSATGREKISVTPEATHGPYRNGWKSLVELTCHSQRWRLHNRARSLFLYPSFPLISRCAVSSLSLTRRLSFSNPRSTVTASAVHRHRDPGLYARETRARDIAPHLRQRIRQRVVFVLRVLLWCGAPFPPLNRISLFLSLNFCLSSLLPLSLPFVPRLDLVRLWSQADNAADSGNRNVWNVCDNALSRR